MDADQVQFSLFILPIIFVNGFSLFKVGRMRCRANKNWHIGTYFIMYWFYVTGDCYQGSSGEPGRRG